MVSLAHIPSQHQPNITKKKKKNFKSKNIEHGCDSLGLLPENAVSFQSFIDHNVN